MPKSKDPHYDYNYPVLGPPFVKGPPRGPPRGPPPPMMMDPRSYGPPRRMPGPPHPMMRHPRGPHGPFDDHDRSTSPPRGRHPSPKLEPGVEHLPLARCRVLYLGSAVPTETARGLEAVQVPLKERFSLEVENMVGIDAWLTVFSSGLMLQYMADMDAVTWFPIQSLHVCAAVKCSISINGITGERSPRFIALDSPDAASSNYPPIFCSIMRRTRGIKVLECHAFITKSEQSAMTLVQASVHAFKHKEGWCTTEPPQARIRQAIHLIPADPVDDKSRSEFNRPPPKEGYFYSSNKDAIRSYNIRDRPAGPPHMGDPYGAPGAPKVSQLPSHPGSYFNGWNDFDDTVFINHGPLSDDGYPRAPTKDHHRRQRSVSPLRDGPRSHQFSPPRQKGNLNGRRSPQPHYDSDEGDNILHRGHQSNERKAGPPSVVSKRHLPANSWSYTPEDKQPSSSNNLIDRGNFSFGPPKDRQPTQPASSKNLAKNHGFSYGFPETNQPRQPSSNNLTDNSSNFSFGPPKDRQPTQPASAKNLAKNNGFTYGFPETNQPKQPSSSNLTDNSSNFSFGPPKDRQPTQPASSKNLAKNNGFSYGFPETSQPKQPSSSNLTDNNFSFGSPKTSQVKQPPSDNSNFSFGPPQTKLPEARSVDVAIENGNFSFGQPKTSQPSTSDNFSFGQPKPHKPSASDGLIDNGNFFFGPPNIKSSPEVPLEPIKSNNPLTNLSSYGKRRGDVRDLFSIN